MAEMNAVLYHLEQHPLMKPFRLVQFLRSIL